MAVGCWVAPPAGRSVSVWPSGACSPSTGTGATCESVTASVLEQIKSPDWKLQLLALHLQSSSTHPLVGILSAAELVFRVQRWVSVGPGGLCWPGGPFLWTWEAATCSHSRCK